MPPPSHLRRAFEAFNRGDWSVFLDRYHPDIELYVSGSAIEVGTYRGRADVIAVWGGILEAWHTVIVKPKEFVDLGQDRVRLLLWREG